MRIAFSISLSMTLTSISFKYLAPFLPSEKVQCLLFPTVNQCYINEIEYLAKKFKNSNNNFIADGFFLIPRAAGIVKIEKNTTRGYRCPM
jgi:hypothetical protein